MKRYLVLIMAILMILTILISGCVSKTGENTPTPGASSGTASQTPEPAGKEPVKLTMWKAGTDETGRNFWNKKIEEYQSLHSNVTIEYAEAPWGNDMDTKLNVAYASGTSPDIIYHAINSMGLRCSQGQYEVITSYFDSWEDKDDFYDSVYNLGTYQGELYGLPFAPGANLYVYRKDFFQEAGLDPEKGPSTWEELAEYAAKLTKRNGNEIVRSGFVIPIDNGQPLFVFARQNGTDLLNDKDEPIFNSPEYVEALEFLTKMFKDLKVTAEVTGKQEAAQPLFSQGKAAMSQITVANLKKLIKEQPEMKDKIGFFFTKKVKESAWTGCEFLFMSSESKNKEAAWEFMKFGTSQDSMREYYKASGAPVVRKSLNDEFIASDPWLNPALVKTVEIGNGTTKTPWTSVMNGLIEKEVLAAAYYGQGTPQELMDKAMEKLQQEIKNFSK